MPDVEEEVPENTIEAVTVSKDEGCVVDEYSITPIKDTASSLENFKILAIQRGDSDDVSFLHLHELLIDNNDDDFSGLVTTDISGKINKKQ